MYTCSYVTVFIQCVHVIMSLSLYSVYNSSLYFILHSPLSFVVPKMALKTFLSKTPSLASLDFDSTQVSEPYASTDLIRVNPTAVNKYIKTTILVERKAILLDTKQRQVNALITE